MNKLLVFFFFSFSFNSFGQQINEVSIGGVGIYPNPFNEQLFIKNENEKDENKIEKVEIYSEIGNLVLTAKHSNLVETQRLPKGSYIIKLYYPNQIISRKVIKK